MPSDTATVLRDIEHHIDLAMQFVAGLDYDAFQNDTRTIFAVTRCLEILSEASRAGMGYRATGLTALAGGGAAGNRQVEIGRGTASPGLFELNRAGLVAAYVLPVVNGKQQALQPMFQTELVGGSGGAADQFEGGELAVLSGDVRDGDTEG